MTEIRNIRSFGDVAEWDTMNRPYIAIFQLEDCDDAYTEARFSAKLYDGERYTGCFVQANSLYSLVKDIEESHPELHREFPGDADPDELMCVYM